MIFLYHMGTEDEQSDYFMNQMDRTFWIDFTSQTRFTIYMTEIDNEGMSHP